MKELKTWDKATDNLKEVFASRYFDNVSDIWWVGSQDEDREILSVNDYFFNLNFIIDCLRYNASKKKMFDYYDMEIEAGYKNKKPLVDFKTFLKLNERKK